MPLKIYFLFAFSFFFFFWSVNFSFSSHVSLNVIYKFYDRWIISFTCNFFFQVNEIPDEKKNTPRSSYTIIVLLIQLTIGRHGKLNIWKDFIYTYIMKLMLRIFFIAAGIWEEEEKKTRCQLWDIVRWWLFFSSFLKREKKKRCMCLVWM